MPLWSEIVIIALSIIGAFYGGYYMQKNEHRAQSHDEMVHEQRHAQIETTAVVLQERLNMEVAVSAERQKNQDTINSSFSKKLDEIDRRTIKILEILVKSQHED